MRDSEFVRLVQLRSNFGMCRAAGDLGLSINNSTTVFSSPLQQLEQSQCSPTCPKLESPRCCYFLAGAAKNGLLVLFALRKLQKTETWRRISDNRDMS